MSNRNKIRYRARVRTDKSDLELKEKNYYLDLVGDFIPQIPAPIIKDHNGIQVLRDDLIELGGSKARFAELLIANTIPDTIVYPSLGYSFNCLALVRLCKMYNKNLILIMPEQPKSKYEISHAHEYCILSQAVNKNLICHQIRAKHYNVLVKFAQSLAKSINAKYIPLGLKHDEVMAMIVKTASHIPEPEKFRVAVGSGMLINGLQIAWPEAQANGIAIRNLYGDVMYANMRSHYIWRNRPAKILPPFPSTKKVDAKVWEFLKPGEFFWNMTKDIEL